MRAWLALRRFRRGAEFRPWLLAIVANEARNRVRNRRRREGLAERAARELAWQPPAAEVGGAERRPPARRARSAARARPQRARLPLRARSRRAGDRGRARHPARHRQVAHGARARSPARRAGGGGMTLEHDLRALADGFPDPPALAPRVLAAARQATARRRRRRQVALLALALLPARAGHGPGGLERPARPRARDVRPARRQDHVRHTAPGSRPRRAPPAARLEGLAGAGAQGPRSARPARTECARRARRDLRGAAAVGRGHHVPVRAAHRGGAHGRAQARHRERPARDDREDDPRQDDRIRDEDAFRSRSTAAPPCS